MSYVFLVTEILCLIFASLSLISNWFIVFLFYKKRISSPESLRLALYLALSDIGYATAGWCHVGYLAFNWSDNSLNYNPYAIIYTNAFLPAFLKMITINTLSMAFDRILAIYLPVYYRRASRNMYANVSFAIAFIWFQIDFWLQILTADYKWRPNCATMQCFVNHTFLSYVGVSNTATGAVIIAISILVFWGLHTMESSNKVNRSAKAASGFRHANRITVGILFCSLFFITIPSLLVVVYEYFTGVSLFSQIGPFYICAILANGFADGLVFIILNIVVKGVRIKGSRSFTVSTIASTRNRSSNPGEATTMFS